MVARLRGTERAVGRISRGVHRLFLREVTTSGAITRCGELRNVRIYSRRHRTRIVTGGSTTFYSRRVGSCCVRFLADGVRVSGRCRRQLLRNVGITFDNMRNTFTGVTTGGIFPSTATINCSSFGTTCGTIMGNRYSYIVLPVRGDFGKSINRIVSLTFFNPLCVGNICSVSIVRGLLTGGNIRVFSVGRIVDRPRTLNRYTRCVGGRNFGAIRTIGATITTGVITRDSECSVTTVTDSRTTRGCKLRGLRTRVGRDDGGAAHFTIFSHATGSPSGTSGRFVLLFAIAGRTNSLNGTVSVVNRGNFGLGALGDHPAGSLV